MWSDEHLANQVLYADVFIIIILILCSIFIVALLFWSFRKARAMIYEWAHKQNVTIVSIEPKNAYGTPYKVSRYQLLYYVKVNEAGEDRALWMILGNPLVGVLIDEIYVHWED